MASLHKWAMHWSGWSIRDSAPARGSGHGGRLRVPARVQGESLVATGDRRMWRLLCTRISIGADATSPCVFHRPVPKKRIQNAYVRCGFRVLDLSSDLVSLGSLLDFYDI